MLLSLIKRNRDLKFRIISLLNWHRQTLGAPLSYWSRLPGELVNFLGMRRAYMRMVASVGEKVYTYPILFQQNTMQFDAHYTYQALWAMKHLRQTMPIYHVDISSDIRFVTQLCVWIPTVYVEYRTAPICATGLEHIQGDVIKLPFRDNSIASLSCLHVIEHIGLGRYGDPLNVNGPREALAELQRVIAPEGKLLVSTPIGQPRTLFNAHRIFAPDYISSMMSSLTLVEFSVVTTRGSYLENVRPDDFGNEDYACGLYQFTK